MTLKSTLLQCKVLLLHFYAVFCLWNVWLWRFNREWTAFHYTGQSRTKPQTQGYQVCFPDQIAFSNTEMFQIKKAFRHSVLPLYMPLYVLHGARRHTKVTELFSNWPNTALLRALHKQPDFQRCSKLIVWRAWNSSTSFKTASSQASLKQSGAETLGGGEGGFCHTTSVLTCWGNEFFKFSSIAVNSVMCNLLP